MIPPAVDESFVFEPTSPERSRVWGWAGGFSEKSGVLVALDAFAHLAVSAPDMRMLLAGDAESDDAFRLREKIAGVPVLAGRIEFIGEIPRERLARDFSAASGFSCIFRKTKARSRRRRRKRWLAAVLFSRR